MESVRATLFFPADNSSCDLSMVVSSGFAVLFAGFMDSNNDSRSSSSSPSTKSSSKLYSNESPLSSGDEIAFSGDEIAFSGDEIAFSGDEIAFSGDEIAFSGDEIAFSGDEIAFSGCLTPKLSSKSSIIFKNESVESPELRIAFKALEWSLHEQRMGLAVGSGKGRSFRADSSDLWRSFRGFSLTSFSRGGFFSTPLFFGRCKIVGWYSSSGSGSRIFETWAGIVGS